jgi:glutathione synthase/RimK-type ligase-like ATP-grasp enzyme
MPTKFSKTIAGKKRKVTTKTKATNPQPTAARQADVQAVRKRPAGATMYAVRTRSRHPSHTNFRGEMRNVRCTTPVVIRLGSPTPLEEIVPTGGVRARCKVINSIDGITTSSDKKLMKIAFNDAKIPTAKGFVYTNGQFRFIGTGVTPVIFGDGEDEMKGPFIAKIRKGSRGNGLIYLEDSDELRMFVENFTEVMAELKMEYTIGSYIFEKYHNYSREYRIHITKEGGLIYTNRKMLKADTPDDQKFFRNDKNCIWYLQNNKDFDTPSNWKDILKASADAIKAVGLDFGAVDVRVQSATDGKGKKRETPKFIIVETNSAPSFGEGTTEAYLDFIPDYIETLIS